MADRNEPVGANLRRFLRGLRNEEAEQYGSGISEGVSGSVRQPAQAGSRSMREVMRGTPATEAAPRISAGRMAVPASMGSEQDNPPSMMSSRMGDAEDSNEAADALRASQMARRAQAARPNARMIPARRPRSASMSADDLNAISLARGEGEGATAANIRRRLAEMGEGMKKGGKVKSKAPMKRMKAGGMVKSSCSRGDGVAKKGKTKGRFV